MFAVATPALEALSVAQDVVVRAGMVDLDVTFFVQTGFFFALVLVLPGLIFKPLLARIEQREARTSGARSDARRMLKEADEQVHIYERATSEEKQKALAERAAARNDAKQKAGKLVEDVREATEARIAEGITAMRADADAARGGIEEEARKLGALIAAKILDEDPATTAGQA
jgi:F0F1-type ATP synthase membrane subunit b/b'